MPRYFAPSRSAAVFACLATLLAATSKTHAQTTSALTLDPWTHTGWGETLDRPLYQAQANVRGADHETTQMFLWDSTGRFRLSPQSNLDPRIGYRYLTITTDSNSRTLPYTLDEISLAFGATLGEWQGGRVTAIAGAGYSGDNLFADTNGIFGIGHLAWERSLNARDTLAITLDYDGSRAFLPDVPLPGFAFSHRADGDGLSWSFGFPRSGVDWAITPDLRLTAGYAVPFTADVSLEYQLGRGVSVFGGYSDFFNAFFLDDRPKTDRFFLHMQRVEVGLRYVNPDLLGWKLYLDAALTVGYAFDQSWSHGFDVRDLEPLQGTEGTPYVGIVLRGRF
jgi:hypothetical protein